MARTGRRPGAGGTREKILAAARSQFGEAGFEGTTVRGIAGAAQVDPALVMHYFGSKEGVFLEAVSFPIDPVELIRTVAAPGREGAGRRLVEFFIATWDSPAGQPLLAILRSVVSSETAAGLMRAFVSREVLGRFAEAFGLDRPQLRAGLAASQLIGLALLRYIVLLEPVASARPEQLAEWVAPGVERYLFDPAIAG